MQAARDILGESGPLAGALPGFRPREEQLAMAAAVEEALAEGRHLLVEAGTGVGKSFAYLAPLLIHLAHQKGTAVVATRTIALQEQLVEKDVPFLLDALGLDLKVALAKGRGNYVCRRRAEMAAADAVVMESDAQRVELERIRAWAETSKDGSLSDLPFRPDPDVWELARAESGNCLHQRCPFFKGCAYQRSRRGLYTARLIIANHALVFSDLALRQAGAKFLPDYDVLVLDEAHEVEDGAAQHFGARVSPLGLARALGRFSPARRRSGLFARVEVGARFYEAIEEVRAAAKTFFRQVDAFRGGAGEKRLPAAGLVPDLLTRPLAGLIALLRREHDAIEDPSLAMEWKARTDRLDETLAGIGLIVGQLEDGLVYWAESSGRANRSVLRAAPVEVADVLRRGLFRAVKSVVLTSATLRVGGSFAHVKRRLGLEEPDELGLGSPFDFKRQCRLIVHPNLPDPRDPEFETSMRRRVRDLVLETGGGAFVLFTSYRSLRGAHDALAEEFAAAGLRVLRQGSDARPRDIMKAFHESRDCVLFATDTFWQGVDVRGENLRLVVITRLPFAVPDHPLQQARLEKIQETGGDPFRELSLPQAVLKLRQGFGRLIRTHEDAGTVAILDPRLKTKRYGTTFLKSLPDCSLATWAGK